MAINQFTASKNKTSLRPSSNESQVVCEALLTSLLGQDVYDRWMKLKRYQKFHKDSIFVSWLLDVAETELGRISSSKVRDKKRTTKDGYSQTTMSLTPAVSFLPPSAKSTKQTQIIQIPPLKLASPRLQAPPADQLLSPACHTVSVPREAITHQQQRIPTINLGHCSPNRDPVGKGYTVEYVCDECRTTFPTKALLVSHKCKNTDAASKANEEELTAECRVCGESLAVAYLRQHAFDAHSTSKNVSESNIRMIHCNHCNYITTFAKSFLNHLKEHVPNNKRKQVDNNTPANPGNKRKRKLAVSIRGGKGRRNTNSRAEVETVDVIINDTPRLILAVNNDEDDANISHLMSDMLESLDGLD